MQNREFRKLVSSRQLTLELLEKVPLSDFLDLALASFAQQTLVEYNGVKYTYGQIAAMRNGYVRLFHEAKVQPGQHIGLAIARSPDYIATLLAVLHVGACYVPLSLTLPPKRILEHAEIAGCQLVVCDRDSVLSVAFNCPVVHAPISTVQVDPIAARSGRKAYVAFTSGTTGRPKAAMNSTVGLFNHLICKGRDCRLGTGTRLAQTAETTFVIHVWQMLAQIGFGGEVVVFPSAAMLDPPRFIRLIDSHYIDVVQVVPTFWRMVLEELDQDTPTLHLRTLVLTGEPLPSDLCRETFARFDGLRVINAYGQSECVDDCCHNVMDRYVADRAGYVPIGNPLGNVRVDLRGKDDVVVEDGKVGEIAVSGVGVGLGYFGDATETARKFRIIDDGTVDVTYFTGDLGRRNGAGQIECLGRADGQVKLFGQRVELGEIEHYLRLAPAVHDAIVMFRQVADQGQLVAFVVASEIVTLARVREFLKVHLPAHMLPQKLIQLEQFRLNVNGKIDRKHLLDTLQQDGGKT